MFLLLPGCLSLPNPTLLTCLSPPLYPPSSNFWFSFSSSSLHTVRTYPLLFSFSSLYSFPHLISPPLPAQYTTQNSPSLLTSTHHHPLQTSSHKPHSHIPLLPGHNCLSRASSLLSFSFSSSSLYTARTYALLPIATSFNTTCYSPSSYFSFSFFVFHFSFFILSSRVVWKYSPSPRDPPCKIILLILPPSLCTTSTLNTNKK